MENEKSAVDSFLGELKDDKIIDQFAQEQPLENKEIDDKVNDREEKPLPFHKDPKIQKYLEKREREMEERLKASIPTPQERQTEEDSFKDTIDAFTNIIGNDTPEKVSALNALKKSLEGLDQRASEKAIERLEDIRQSEVDEDIEAEEELDEAFDNIEDTFDVDITSNNPIAIKTRQEFVAYVQKIAPKDRDGDVVEYPDMISAWETFSEHRTKEPNRAKELASRGMTRSAETTSNPQERVTWNKVDEFIDTLK